VHGMEGTFAVADLAIQVIKARHPLSYVHSTTFIKFTELTDWEIRVIVTINQPCTSSFQVIRLIFSEFNEI